MGLKNYKFVWFTEGGWTGKVSIDNPNMRNDVSTKYVLGAEHYPIFQIPNVIKRFEKDHFDFAIVTLPKTNIDQLAHIDLVGELRKISKKVISMQEGPHWYFQDYKMDEQIWWYNTLTEFDMLFAHNKKDVKYYGGLTSKPVHKMPTLMLAERLEIIPRNQWGDAVMIGGNMVRWYGGFDSYIVAQEFDMPIYAPSMGRKIDREEEMDIKHYPYMTWVEWMNALSEIHVGVHMMPTHAAGTFTLNCAFHGIPCIGYKGLDTQEELHPHLSVNDGDIEEAKYLANKLKNDDGFYHECSITCRELYEKSLYTEKNFVPYITKIFDGLL